MFQYYDNELCKWFNVGVQIFLVISGFLYGRKSEIDPVLFLRTNFPKILIPYLLLMSIILALYGIFHPELLEVTNVLKSLVCASTIPGLGHLWFVGYILFCYLITPYLYWIKKASYSYVKPKQVVLLYVSIIVLVQVVGIAFDSYFAPDRISCYIIGFFMADLFDRFGSAMKKAVSAFFIVSAFICVGIEITIKYILSIDLSGYYQIAFQAFGHYSHLLLGIALFLILASVFNSSRYSKLLVWSDKYSYPIYLVHLIFILSPFSLMSITRFSGLNVIITVACIVITGIALQYLTNLISNKGLVKNV